MFIRALYLSLWPVLGVTHKGTQQGMSLEGILGCDKRHSGHLGPRSPLWRPVRAAVLLVLIEIVNSRTHHSQQIFTEKIDRRDFFYLSSGRCLLQLCTPHGRSGRGRQKTGSATTVDHAEYGEQTCFSAYEYPKRQNKFFWVDIYDEHN